VSYLGGQAVCSILDSHYGTYPVAAVFCACGFEGIVKVAEDVPDSHVKRELRLRGWRVEKNVFTCPTCVLSTAKGEQQ
jgi:hypothetical protein